ncbi:MAG: hypothetical protein IJU91_00105, partial [Selenomonadaceae bacterium]|nr:hypothetical protein [Selenomonadaceae bacterium]
MDLDDYKKNDLKRVQQISDNLNSNLINLLRIKYATIFSVLVYGLSNNNPFMTLLPLCISISIFIMDNKYRENICRNAAYIIVFYSREIAPEWELRLSEYIKESKKNPSI